MHKYLVCIFTICLKKRDLMQRSIKMYSNYLIINYRLYVSCTRIGNKLFSSQSNILVRSCDMRWRPLNVDNYSLVFSVYFQTLIQWLSQMNYITIKTLDYVSVYRYNTQQYKSEREVHDDDFFFFKTIWCKTLSIIKKAKN